MNAVKITIYNSNDTNITKSYLQNTIVFESFRNNKHSIISPQNRNDQRFMFIFMAFFIICIFCILSDASSC